MLRIAICDDESLYIQQLSTLIKHILSTQSQPVEIKTYVSGLNLMAFISENPTYFDLIFLDNLMPQVNGINVAKTIRLYNKTVPLIFVTTTKEYAFDSYQVKASHYLLKPVSEKELNLVLTDYLLNAKSKNDATLTVTLQHEIHTLTINQVYYFESKLRKITAHTLAENIVFYEKLSNLETQLPNHQFIRTHQSYLVNMTYIKSIKNGFLILSNLEEIPISKKYQTTVKEAFMTYLTQQLN
ncbi:MAG TPA: hypothetical protein DCY20_01565 [Firmicutes bacterium]|nr:hypothetical protein [Bacillota bacterium]